MTKLKSAATTAKTATTNFMKVTVKVNMRAKSERDGKIAG